MIFVSFVCLILAGCEKQHSPDPKFIVSNDIALSINGHVKVKYVPETFQIGFSRDKRQFRVHNDTMSEYFIMTCSELPESEGQNIKCTLKYTCDGKANYFGSMTYNVAKLANDGTIWLWNSKKSIGVTVKVLKQVKR